MVAETNEYSILVLPLLGACQRRHGPFEIASTPISFSRLFVLANVLRVVGLAISLLFKMRDLLCIEGVVSLILPFLGAYQRRHGPFEIASIASMLTQSVGRLLNFVSSFAIVGSITVRSLR